MTMERRYYANEQYCQRKCLEISAIPTSVVNNGPESNVLEILEETDVSVDPSLVEDCHRVPSKGSPRKVIIKLNRRKDIRGILLSKNKLKNLKPEPVNLPGEANVSINSLNAKIDIVQKPVNCRVNELIKVCASTARNCGPNVKICGVLVTFPGFGSAKAVQ